MEEKTKKLMKQSFIVGGIVGSVVVALTSKGKCCSCLTNYYHKAVDVAKFVNENRNEIVSQLKLSSDNVTKAIDATNSDLKAITQNIKHLKDSSSEMISTVQEAKDQLVYLYEKGKQQLETIPNEVLKIELKKDV